MRLDGGASLGELGVDLIAVFGPGALFLAPLLDVQSEAVGNVMHIAPEGRPGVDEVEELDEVLCFALELRCWNWEYWRLSRSALPARSAGRADLAGGHTSSRTLGVLAEFVLDVGLEEDPLPGAVG